MSIDCETLRALISYCPVTGALTWKPRPRELFDKEGTFKAWNGRYPGRPALDARHPAGYRHGAIFGKFVLAHRAAWAIVHGEWPSDQIDHVNGNPADNRLENLRIVTSRENSMNMKANSRNSSGVMGVCWNKANGKWRAHIAGKTLGDFCCKEDAIRVRKQAEENLGYHPNHGRAA
jgi:hypothetical protein